uniref:Actin-related protein 7 n=1 Tax=Chenopodium quinoa TaxID=63459 RepID=A0A803MMX1_CHEQI
MEAVVVDAGSKLLKAGFAIPDQNPPLVIPTQMKKVLEDGSTVNASTVEDITIDPIVRGFVRDWDAMEDLLHHGLREQLVQLLFETFNVSGFYAAEQGVLSLYAVGRISGCSVDIGHGKIDIAPVIEGAVHHISSRRFEVGGIDLTKLLAQELGKSNPEVITIGRERYIVGEALFQPSILGLEANGIVEQLVHSISTVSSENHRQLLENTVLCGGTSCMAGFEDRFQKECNLSSSAIRPSLVKAPEYMPEDLTKYSAWIGGAILAKVVFPQNQHVTKADYDETGPSIVHRKCF